MWSTNTRKMFYKIFNGNNNLGLQKQIENTVLQKAIHILTQKQ